MFFSGLMYSLLYEYYFYLLIPVILFVVVLLFINIKIAPFLIAFITPLLTEKEIREAVADVKDFIPVSSIRIL